MINYRIDERNGIIVALFSQDIDFDELLQWHKNLEREGYFSSPLKGVADMRSVRLALERKDMARIFDYISERGLRMGRWALLIEEPKMTALAMIFERYSTEHHEMEVFCSEEGASAYLGVDVTALLGGLSTASTSGTG